MRLDEFDRPSFDSELLARLKDSEDSFVERKEQVNTTKIKRTGVAFANSLPEGRDGLIFIGVRDSGEPLPPGQFKVKPAEQKARMALGECYPEIPGLQYRSLHVGEAELLAIIVPASPKRPHFTGGAYVRNGASNKEASADLFREMIADLTEPARLLRPWKGRDIHVIREYEPIKGHRSWPDSPATWRVVEVDPVGITLSVPGAQTITASWQRVQLQPIRPKQPPLVRISLD